VCPRRVGRIADGRDGPRSGAGTRTKFASTSAPAASLERSRIRFRAASRTIRHSRRGCRVTSSRASSTTSATTCRESCRAIACWRTSISPAASVTRVGAAQRTGVRISGLVRGHSRRRVRRASSYPRLERAPAPGRGELRRRRDRRRRARDAAAHLSSGRGRRRRYRPRRRRGRSCRNPPLAVGRAQGRSRAGGRHRGRPARAHRFGHQPGGAADRCPRRRRRSAAPRGNAQRRRTDGRRRHSRKHGHARGRLGKRSRWAGN